MLCFYALWLKEGFAVVDRKSRPVQHKGAWLGLLAVLYCPTQVRGIQVRYVCTVPS